MSKKYSVVIPAYNEEKNVVPLFKEVLVEMRALKAPFEIIFVDDASTDDTFEQLKKFCKPATIIRMRKNSGQSTALDAGIKYSTGDIIITMDGDGQDYPKHIPEMLELLDTGYDCVCAWRFQRQDSWHKKFLSNGARMLRTVLVKDGVHDAGTQFRVYRRECFEDLDLYGELHRMIPALLRWRGFRITEMKVAHRPRIYGKSKYTITRVVKGFLDMVYIWFWRKYSQRPLHLFGGVGLLSMFIGFLISLLLLYMRFFQGYMLSNKIWPVLAFFFVFMGVQLLITGLLAVQFVEINNHKRYYIAETIQTKD